MTNVENRGTIDIENSGNSVVLALQGRTIVDLVIEGDGAADYALDVRGSRGGAWMQGVGSAYTGGTNYDDTLRTGAGEIRVRCTSGTSSANDTADILLSAGGR